MISDDLVNSYHLLLCALDLVLTNALLCNARKELLNPDFRGSCRRAGQRSSCQLFYGPLFLYCGLRGKGALGVLGCSTLSGH